VIPYLFTSLVRIHVVDGTGRFFVLIPFIIAFISDSGAYFAGLYFGSRKLAPAISPKKTVEGAIGGVAFCIAASYLYAGLVSFLFQLQVNYIAVAVFAILGSSISVLGDLTASLIKRYYKIKDYGNLIPGHGGIMDRFDSIWFVAPLVYFLCKIFPIFL
jgi:phosphatidate cytidylyltransferase